VKARGLETIGLVLIGVLLAVAVGHDVVHRTERIRSFRGDARVLRHYVHAEAGRHVSRPRFFRYATHDTACADAGFDGAVRLCLQLRRTGAGVHPVGGWRAPTPAGDPGRRFGCFGAAERHHVCHRAKRPLKKAGTPGYGRARVAGSAAESSEIPPVFPSDPSTARLGPRPPQAHGPRFQGPLIGPSDSGAHPS
jgi:hypothetical protein